jgi:hypothetical protein
MDKMDKCWSTDSQILSWDFEIHRNRKVSMRKKRENYLQALIFFYTFKTWKCFNSLYVSTRIDLSLSYINNTVVHHVLIQPVQWVALL